MFKGDAISLKSLEGGVVEMNFDLKGESVNKFNSVTVQELGKALDELGSVKDLKGVLVSSGSRYLLLVQISPSLKVHSVQTSIKNPTRTIFSSIGSKTCRCLLLL
ncbi:MAG: hypothetical protein KJP25_09185, partial [Gammaproteobacteria bacterium]|nr:hypothetical protein [Gammaproteobacteria bacterium]